VAQISAASQIWEEDAHTFRTCTSVQQALKKQIISVFETMYLDIVNDNMVGYANISARDMLDHLFETYGNITAADLEINFEHMRRAWDSQQPVESLFKHIQDCADSSEAGGILIGRPQQINVGYAKISQTTIHAQDITNAPLLPRVVTPMTLNPSPPRVPTRSRNLSPRNLSQNDFCGMDTAHMAISLGNNHWSPQHLANAIIHPVTGK
jgi:hypothetical protein